MCFDIAGITVFFKLCLVANCSANVLGSSPKWTITSSTFPTPKLISNTYNNSNSISNNNSNSINNNSNSIKSYRSNINTIISSTRSLS